MIKPYELIMGTLLVGSTILAGFRSAEPVNAATPAVITADTISANQTQTPNTVLTTDSPATYVTLISH